jgi:lambda family phage portal protein
MIDRILDSMIGAVSPVAALKRMQARKLLRSYAAAEPSRTGSGRTPKNQSADQEALGPFGADAARAWARDLVRNNAYAWGVVDSIVSNVIASGINALSILEVPGGSDLASVNEKRDKVWSYWSEVCEINNQYTFSEIQQICMREVAEAGEVLVRYIKTPEMNYRGIRRPVPLALEIIEVDRLAGDKDTYTARITKEGGNRIIRGVEIDDLGRPVAYWIYKDHPSQPYSFNRTPVRIPANEIRHLFRRERVGQTRGITWFAPALAWMRDLGTYVDNEMTASAISSCFTVAIKTDTPMGSLGSPEGLRSTDEAGNQFENIQPGLIMRLKSNEDVVGINPGRPNSGSEPWIQLILRSIAVGTGLSYEIVARDYSQTSYSSSRTSQLEDRRRFRTWQNYMINNLCQPTWDAFCDAAAIAGIEGFPTSEQLYADRRAVAPVDWQTPQWEWVDPQVEQQANESSLNSFTNTYANVLGSRGMNYRSVFKQIAKEKKMLRDLDLMTPTEQQLAISAAQSGGAPIPSSSSEQASSSTEPATQAGSGEMMGISTLQFNRNRKAILKTLEDLASGAITEAAAKVFLSSIGMNEQNVQLLIDDAKDGSVDTAIQEDVRNAV